MHFLNCCSTLDLYIWSRKEMEILLSAGDEEPPPESRVTALYGMSFWTQAFSALSVPWPSFKRSTGAVAHSKLSVTYFRVLSRHVRDVLYKKGSHIEDACHYSWYISAADASKNYAEELWNCRGQFLPAYPIFLSTLSQAEIRVSLSLPSI